MKTLNSIRNSKDKVNYLLNSNILLSANVLLNGLSENIIFIGGYYAEASGDYRAMVTCIDTSQASM